MKKTLIALASVAALGAAHADVTLYGSVDGGIRSQSAGDSKGNAVTYIEGGGIVQTNKWGIQGSEAIDGGLKASFRLESNLNLNGGSGGAATYGVNRGPETLFDREAWVKLGDGTNEIGFGKQYTPAFALMCTYDSLKCLGASYFGTASSSVDQAINVLGKRWDQTLGYTYSSPLLNASLLYASQVDTSGAIEGAVPGSTVGRGFGGSISSNVTNDISVGYAHQTEVTANRTGNTAANTSGYPSTTATSIGYVLGNNTGTTYNVIKDVIGASYQVSPAWKILGNQSSARTSDATPEKLVDMGIGFQFTPSSKYEIAANYQSLKQNSGLNTTADGQRLTMLGGYAKYFFSKTTYAYIEMDRTQWDSGYTGNLKGTALTALYGTANAESSGGTAPASINAYSIGLNKAF